MKLCDFNRVDSKMIWPMKFMLSQLNFPLVERLIQFNLFSGERTNWKLCLKSAVNLFNCRLVRQMKSSLCLLTTRDYRRMRKLLCSFVFCRRMATRQNDLSIIKCLLWQRCTEYDQELQTNDSERELFVWLYHYFVFMKRSERAYLLCHSWQWIFDWRWTKKKQFLKF